MNLTSPMILFNIELHEYSCLLGSVEGERAALSEPFF